MSEDTTTTETATTPQSTDAAPASTPENATAEATDHATTQPDADEDRVRFTDLGIDGRVLSALTDIGYENPSPIQAATIPALLAGRDVVGLAQTGTGKTAAFAVPALSKLAELNDVHGPASSPQVLVLAPTRELALQVAEAFSTYAAHLDGFTVLPVYGGSPYGPQLAGLRRGAQVVVGTPGRVIDHISKGSLDLSGLQYVVLDEADEMLRMGFAEDVETILASTPEQKQVALFSATMPPAIRKIAAKYLNDPAEITVAAKTTTRANIRQRYVQVMNPHKLDAITRILEVEQYDGVIVFVRTKLATEELADKLTARGFTAAAINGDIPQTQRERTVDALRSGNVDVLVATDVAARGLDVERISLVINYDIPHDTESYVHRIGRTGRAGRAGDAILFMTPREKYLLRSIERATRQPVEQMTLPSVDAVNSTRIGRFAEQITQTRQAEDLSVFRDLVEEYVREQDVDAVEVAAALAVMAQGGRPLLMEEPPPLPAKGPRGGKDRGRTSGRGPGAGKATYRIAVGRRQRVMPGSIVGAIANEGGIDSSDIGGIDIRSDHSLVELPAELPEQTLRALSRTRIGGQLIELELDRGPRGGNRHAGRSAQADGFRRREDRADRKRGDRPDHGGGKGRDKPWNRKG
ncbi:ATP-dependent RNA helicase DeaD [Tersicoccus solisilvae]|uniref:ATP-dependent RNA helicase DeaD n=1 Tax=Tersicoccus solisilvae TaxID=1882339 RepID=A0ABQ1NX08_9MICC|nr:DEAD/DEAH box helicase [Tersicoccus solisilvae]GGC86556.1 ATP-dependent RNA helicase DeaD [Tersicoccus solisilvae]